MEKYPELSRDNFVDSNEVMVETVVKAAKGDIDLKELVDQFNQKDSKRISYD
jgi:hypothetical protein